MRYVTIDEITGKVVNVGQVAGPAQLEDAGEARRHIVETDWAAGSDPAVGDEWDGQIPTTFTRPGSELDNLSAQELLDRMAEQRAAMAETETALRQRLG